MKRPAVLALLCLALLACALACAKNDEEPPPPQAQTELLRHEDVPKYSSEPEPDYDADNLLNLAYGAAVVSRTAELSLEASAVHAIDGISSTSWMSPPQIGEQTLVFSLPGLARIRRVGVTTVDAADAIPATVRFDASLDGNSWREVQTLTPKPSKEPQLVDIPPVEARFLRVQTTGPGRETIVIRSLHALGSSIAGTDGLKPAAPPFAGCWTVNGRPALFAQNGARITGTIAADPPIHLDGGTDGRVASFMWIQGPMWGHAAVTLTPDGSALSGIRFHEEPSTQYVADGWFGTRCTSAPLDFTDAHDRILERAKRWTLYGLAFDAEDRLLPEPSAPTLDALVATIQRNPPERFRITARELRDRANAAARTAKRIEALRGALRQRGVDLARIDFVAAGSELKEPPIHATIQRSLASRVDLERFER